MPFESFDSLTSVAVTVKLDKRLPFIDRNTLKILFADPSSTNSFIRGNVISSSSSGSLGRWNCGVMTMDRRCSEGTSNSRSMDEKDVNVVVRDSSVNASSDIRPLCGHAAGSTISIA